MINLRCKNITKRGTRCLNQPRINGLCLIHYNSKIHKPRYLKKLKVEKYYSGKLNRFWEISEKILLFIKGLIIFIGVCLFLALLTCNSSCQKLCDASYCLEGCLNIFWVMLITWVIAIISYIAFQFAGKKKEETRWREK